MIEGFARTPSSRAHPALSRAYSPFPFNQVLWTLLLLVTREYVLSNIAVVELIFFLICGAVWQNNVNWPFVVVLVWFCCLRSRLRPAQLPRRLIFIVPFRSMTPRVAGTQGIQGLQSDCKFLSNLLLGLLLITEELVSLYTWKLINSVWGKKLNNWARS